MLSGGGHKGMISGNKSVSMTQYTNAPGAYVSNQQHLRGNGHNPPHQQIQHQQKPNNKYSSSTIGVINPQSSNVTLSSLSTTPQVRTRSPHAKVRGTG